MQNDVNENRKEHAEKAYKCAAVLADIPKMSKIRDYALSFLGFDPSQW